MRESASLASSFERRQLPAGLIQRLEMLQNLALQAKAAAYDGKRGTAVARRPLRRRAEIIILAWFSLGVVTSGAAGVGALLGLRALAAKTGGAWERVEVAIDRSERADAPLGLRVTGGDGQPVHFVLAGVPDGVRPSRGALVGPGTWVLAGTDIDGLHLSLDDGAPRAFTLKIARLAPTGVAKSGSVVQVHLVGGAAPAAMQAAAEPPGKDAAKAEAAAAQAPAAEVVSARPKAAGTPVARAADKPAAAGLSVVRPSHWPEGASGLGAKSREQEGKGWWSAPPPAWSPFKDGAGKP